MGEHLLEGEHFGENTFWGENTLGRTLLEGRTLWGEQFFKGEDFGENNFFLKKLRFDEGRTPVPTVCGMTWDRSTIFLQLLCGCGVRLRFSNLL